jgi:hypothetical protein
MLPPLGFIAMVWLLAERPHAALLVTRAAAVVVPTLAALAAMRMSRRGWPVIVVALTAAAVLWRDELPGQVATLALLVLSCVAVGSLMPRLGSPKALAAGAAALAIADITLLLLGPVGAAADALDTVRLGHLPSFGEAVVGSVHMGYGDLLVAGIGGAVAARSPGGPSRVGLLTLVLCLVEAALLMPSPYPATIPVVGALAVDALWRARRGVRARRTAPQPA